ncbi:MAG: metallo-mystery pair system four-Cys motif protein [Gammaproteobacteria bacterium]|nr:metallo-mystery pair system four-Cys motif protein [Gammaproteobacteria bacterium]
MIARAVATGLAALLAACGEPPVQVQIPFIAVLDGMPMACDAGGEAALTDLRFYVYDVQLRDTAGADRKLELRADNDWQQVNLALLDLETGAGRCVNGTAKLNNALVGTVAAGDYRGLSFTLGVPFAQNHGDPLRAAPPLGDAAMHWHWRGGYKFLRAGFVTVDDGFWIHLGSTGCEGTLQDISGCSAPNRVTVQLHDFVPGRDVVVVDLGALVSGAELDDATATDCSSGPAEEYCVTAFRALGLDHASGMTSGVQSLFSSRTSP